MTPTDTWLRTEGAAAYRSLTYRSLRGYFHRGKAYVEFIEGPARRIVAEGRGATIEEACADACNDLQRRAEEDAAENDRLDAINASIRHDERNGRHTP